MTEEYKAAWFYWVLTLINAAVHWPDLSALSVFCTIMCILMILLD